MARWCAMCGAVIKLCLPINLCIHGALLVVPRLHSVLTLLGRVEQASKSKETDFGSIVFTDNKSGKSVEDGLCLVLCVQTAVLEGSTEGL